MTAPEMIGHLKAITTVDEVILKLESMFDLIREDVYNIVRSRGWYFQDFDGIYSESCEMLAMTLIKGHLTAVKMFYQLQNAEIAIRWIIQRIVSNMRNIGFDQRYKNCVFMKFNELHEILVPIPVDFEIEIMYEDLYRLDRLTLLRGLQKVWEEALEDFEFDEIDFQELCEKFGFTVEEVMGNTLLLKAEQAAGGNQQLVLFF